MTDERTSDQGGERSAVDDEGPDVDEDGTDGSPRPGTDGAKRTDATGVAGSTVDAADDPARHDRIQRHAVPGPGNSLMHWPEAKHPLRLTLNVLVVWLVRYSPSLKLKNWLLRRLGADVGDGVAFALTATPDVFWPELLTVEDHAIVGYDATLLCHAFLQDEYRTGEVVVGERATIGAGAIVLPGVEIGPEAKVGANAVVTRDVPPGTTVVGVPARPIDDG